MKNLQPTSMGKYSKLPLNIWNKTRSSTFTSVIQHSTRSPGHSDQTRKINKRHQIGKEEVKLSLIIDDMILYIDKFKESTKKLLDLINEFSKVTR